jgi:hypothetical protein
VEDGLLALAGPFPGGDVGEVVVVALGLAVLVLALGPEVATRPAFSSCWLSSSPLPVTLTRVQNSARSAGMSSSALRRPSSVRSMPQYSHMTWPSSRWKESTERSPSIDRNFSMREVTRSSASATALPPTGGRLVRAM